jgi:N-sulfoglucosamine sulfohydrolase
MTKHTRLQLIPMNGKRMKKIQMMGTIAMGALLMALTVKAANNIAEPFTVFKKSDAPAIPSSQKRPNILWITCEDISPYLGCYGFEQAQTPNLDKLAEEGVRFTRAYASATVCAVSRSSLLSGMYPPTIGTQSMRCRTELPAAIPAYSKLFREAGYYCTNNSKTDYNSSFERIKKTIWDETSKTAHWKNRPAGKPFFAVFNSTITHENQLKPERIAGYVKRLEIPATPRINPAEIHLPAYHPDLPEIREDWARLHDLITLMDSIQGKLIQELIDAGLYENTIIFFYSDHGGMLSRSKRYIYNGGTQVPLIIRVPEKWKHLAIGEPGSVNHEFVEFVDLTKSVLSFCDIEVPEVMQGRIIAGPHKEPAPETLHFYRDRMAERIDFSRAVTDGEYYYIRNFFPHKPHGRDSRYGNTVQRNWAAWESWYDGNPEAAGPIHSQFYEPKAAVELFNMESDPDQVRNRADHPALQAKMARFDADLDDWMIRNRDVGLVPESMLYELIGEGRAHQTIYDYGQSEDYAVEKVLAAAKAASSAGADSVNTNLKLLRDETPEVRFWGAYGLFLNRISTKEIQVALTIMILNDRFAANRIMAAQALAWCGDAEAAFTALRKEIHSDANGYTLLLAINALQYSHTDDRLTKDDWAQFKKVVKVGKRNPGATFYGFDYSQRIIDDALELWPERRRVD